VQMSCPFAQAALALVPELFSEGGGLVNSE
jgi:hypothetical protein